MADSKVLAAVKALQMQFEGQTIPIHQTLQQYMSIVDSRLEDLRSHIQGSSSVLAASSGSAHRSFLVAEGHSGHIDLSSVLRSMKMEIPKFDGSDPNGWVFRIEEFFLFP